jgi:hypothetical protein
MPVGPLGSGPLGTIPFGSAREDFGLTSAVSESPVIVRVTFNDLFDLSDPFLTSPSSYTIAPTVVVHSVTIISANAVRLTVDYLTSPVYTVTVAGMKSLWNKGIDPDFDTATFFGYSADNRFDAVAVGRTKVRLLFEATMLEDAALIDPSNYSITDMDGVAKTIIEVIPEGPPGARIAVALVLTDELTPTVLYTAKVTSTDVKTSGGYSISPNYDDFQLFEQTPRIEVPYEWMSGVFEGGLLAGHGGLAFFSPALATAAPDSVIEVDDVSVCTRAYDQYVWPDPPDPPVFHTWSPGTPNYLLSGSSVLFATFDKLGGFRFDFVDLREDVVVPVVDSTATATLVEVLDPTRVSRLSQLETPLFAEGVEGTNKLGTSQSLLGNIVLGGPLLPVIATPFILADNLTPIPPGTTTVIVLHP